MISRWKAPEVYTTAGLNTAPKVKRLAVHEKIPSLVALTGKRGRGVDLDDGGTASA